MTDVSNTEFLVPPEPGYLSFARAPVLTTSDDLDELAKALAEAQGAIEDPRPNRENEHHGWAYADLKAVLGVIRPEFSKVGLSIFQIPVNGLEPNEVGVLQRVMHSSGQWMQGTFYITCPGSMRGLNSFQIAGIVITYLRRYLASSAAGIYADFDSDGEVTQEEIDEDFTDEIERLVVESEIDPQLWADYVVSENLSQEEQVLQLKRRIRKNAAGAQADSPSEETAPEGEEAEPSPDTSSEGES